VNYRVSLDQFKFQLGIPQCIDIDLDSEPLEPMFKLIRLLDRLSKDQQQLTDESARLSGQRDTSRLRAQYRTLLEQAALTKGTNALTSILRKWAGWADLSDMTLDLRIDQLRGERQKLLSKKVEAPENKLPEADQQQLDRVEADLHLASFERF